MQEDKAMIDIEKARRDTPGCETFIHFDNAGASPMPEPAFRAMTDHLEAERAVGGYEAERLAKKLDDLFEQYRVEIGDPDWVATQKIGRELPLP